MFSRVPDRSAARHARAWVRTPVFTLMAVSLALLAPAASAQYKWKDASGRTIYSDQPPPADTKPLPMRTGEPMPPAAPRPGAKPVVAARPTSGTGDPELEHKRKAQEKQAAEQKAKEDVDRQARLTRICEESRADLRTLESGMRLARINAAGEREFLSDEDRAARIATARRNIEEACKSGG